MKIILQTELECNTSDLVGVDEDLAKEATFTKRKVRCAPERGWELEADPKHAKTLLHWFGFEGDAVRGSVTGSRETRKPQKDELDDNGELIPLRSREGRVPQECGAAAVHRQ